MAKPKSGMVKSNLFIQPQVRKAMQFLAEKRGTTYSALVRQAMREFVIENLKLEKNTTAVESQIDGITGDSQ